MNLYSYVHNKSGDMFEDLSRLIPTICGNYTPYVKDSPSVSCIYCRRDWGDWLELYHGRKICLCENFRSVCFLQK